MYPPIPSRPRLRKQTGHWLGVRPRLYWSLSGSGATGFGYSFADIATANLIDAHLKRIVIGGNCLDIPEIWFSLVHAIRNLGRPGICSMAISAVDNLCGT